MSRDANLEKREDFNGAEAEQCGTLCARTTRRSFLRRASLLSLAIPGAGAALTACKPEGGDAAKSKNASKEPGTAGGEGSWRNPDSKLEAALEQEGGHPTSSFTKPLADPVSPEVAFERFDPALPPPPERETLRLHWRARETPIRISPNQVVAGWTFEDNIPAPIVHCRVGDTVEFTLTNETNVLHSMDFHAAQVDPETAFHSVMKGESVSYAFKPRYAGAFLYHCGTAPVLMHIGAGMFGAIIVSPREPLPPAREFVLVQSEYYFGPPINTVYPFDYSKMLEAVPDVVAFNGRPSQYIREPIRAKRGERVRFWVVNAGPTLPCGFHVVGEQFETVYLGSPPGSAIHGVQTFSVPAGGGMVFELLCDVAGQFPFVNHSFGHGQKGAIGHLIVEE